MTSPPLDYFEDLCNYLDKNGIGHRISGSSLKLKYMTTRIGNESTQTGETTKVQIEVLRVTDTKSCVKFSFRNAASKVDKSCVGSIAHFMEVRDSAELRMFCDTTYAEDVVETTTQL